MAGREDAVDHLATALTKIAVLEERIKLQTAEYERRLDDLNHAHAQAVTDKAQFLPRETYNTSEALLTIWRREVDAALTSSSARHALTISIFSASGTILALVLWGVSIFWGRA